MRIHTRFSASVATALLRAVGCSAQQGGEEQAVIATTVDPTLEPSAPALPDAEDGGARPLATVTFDGEPQSDFVANELIVVPADRDALDAFLAPVGVIGGVLRQRRFRVASAGTVDLWAPTNITVADTTSAGSIRNFGGTIAESPFAAGVIALIRAADPSAPLADTFSALWDTANSWSTGADVRVWPSARDAVLQVLGDAPPRVDIVEPTGSPYDEFDAIPLRADLDDLDSPAEEYSIRWSYQDHADTMTVIGTSESGDEIDVFLCDGTYEVRAEAIHPSLPETAEATVTIEVQQLSVPPTRCEPDVLITAPDDGAVILVGDTIAFTAAIEDDDDSTEAPIYALTWYQDGPGSTVLAQDVLSFDTSALPAGIHDVYVEYGVASDSVTTEVLDTANTSPNPVIGDPDDGATLIYSDDEYDPVGIDVPSGGLAYDAEDGWLAEEALIWRYRLAGTTDWTQAGSGYQLTITLPFVGQNDTWEIRLTAVDSEGLEGNDVNTIVVVTPAG